MDSNVHGMGPCPMCSEWDHVFLAAGAEGGGEDTGEVGDIGNEEEGERVEVVDEGGKVDNAVAAAGREEGGEGDGGRKVSGCAKKRSGVEAEQGDVSGSSKKVRPLDSVWDVVDVVEARGFALDPNLIGSEVDVVGTTKFQRGRSCGDQVCCGTALLHVGSHVCFHKTRFAWRDGAEEDVLEVYFLQDGLRTCKVGYLPKHLAFRADRYDGLCARIVEMYSTDRDVCDCVAKRHKHHRNFGCCVAVVLGMKDMFAIK